MAIRAADDIDEIRRNIERIRAERPKGCAMREKLSLNECWCFHAAPDGSNLPCPPLTESSA